MSADPEVLKRLKKLLARATSSEPHEAALALEMAQKMMAEHGLTRLDVEVGPVVEEPLKSVASATKAKSWELRLMQGVAKALGCELLFQRGQMFDVVDGYRVRVTDSRMFAHYQFVGPETEAKLAQYAAHVLQRQLQRARTKFTATLSADVARWKKTQEVDAYCLAWVEKALSKVSKLDPRPSVKDAIAKYMAKYTEAKPVGVQHRKGGSADAALRGAKDGEAAELNRPVEGGAAQSRALVGHRLALGSGRGDGT